MDTVMANKKIKDRGVAAPSIPKAGITRRRIAFELKAIGSPVERIDDVYYNLKYKAKAVTCSNIKEHISIVLFNYHKSRYDYINSIIHEAEHIKQHMLKAYNVVDEGEAPAYTVGYIAMRMLMINPKLKLL